MLQVLEALNRRGQSAREADVMYVITIKARPKPEAEQASEVGGAYAVCWIDFQLQDGAEHLARFYVEQGGWAAEEIKQVLWVDEDYYDTNFEGEERDDLKQFYAEAAEDGVCVVFHEWPADAEDAEEPDEPW